MTAPARCECRSAVRHRARHLIPNLEALQRNLDMITELGFARGKVDLKQHADISIVQAAAKRSK